MSSDYSKKARVNYLITAREVRLIGADGEQIGIVPINEAQAKAQEVNLDLVEISSTSKPPVCRIMDYGKYLFELGKKHKKKSKVIQVKEIKLRPVTDIGDYTVKVRKAIDFLKSGNKVKFTVRFRGRELSYQEQGMAVLKRIENDLTEYGVVEQHPKFEGRQMVMLFAAGKLKKAE